MRNKHTAQWAWMTTATTIAAVAAMATACGHQQQAAAPLPRPPAQQTQLSSVPSVQPYTIVQQLPSAAPVAAKHAHRSLHVVVQNKHSYLYDTYGHRYDIGRDSAGHIFPAYYDRHNNRTLPLYYDSTRDRYYDVAEDPDDSRYYRHYVDDSDYERYYTDTNDYHNYQPTYDDRPVIYEPTPVYHSNHNTDWLWAIPVIVAAAVLLQPHNHHNNTPTAYYSPQRPAYVRPAYPISVHNNDIYNYNVDNVRVVNRPYSYPRTVASTPHPGPWAHRTGSRPPTGRTWAAAQPAQPWHRQVASRPPTRPMPRTPRTNQWQHPSTVNVATHRANPRFVRPVMSQPRIAVQQREPLHPRVVAKRNVARHRPVVAVANRPSRRLNLAPRYMHRAAPAVHARPIRFSPSPISSMPARPSDIGRTRNFHTPRVRSRPRTMPTARPAAARPMRFERPNSSMPLRTVNLPATTMGDVRQPLGRPLPTGFKRPAPTYRSTALHGKRPDLGHEEHHH